MIPAVIREDEDLTGMAIRRANGYRMSRRESSSWQHPGSRSGLDTRYSLRLIVVLFR